MSLDRIERAKAVILSLSELLTIDIGHIMSPNSTHAREMKDVLSRETMAFTMRPLKPENHISSHVLK